MPTAKGRGGKQHPPQGPPIKVPCMALDQRALVEAMRYVVKSDVAECYVFPADRNFMRCLQRFVEVVPGARDFPIVDIDTREIPGISEQGVLTVNRDFLTLFRTAWAKEFPMVITAAVGDQFAAFSAHSAVWYEILLRSTGPAMLEHWYINEPLPPGICLCHSSADPKAAPISLPIHAWEEVVSLWPQQYPDPGRQFISPRPSVPKHPALSGDGLIIDDELPEGPPLIDVSSQSFTKDLPSVAPKVSAVTTQVQSDFEKLGYEIESCIGDEVPAFQNIHRAPEMEQTRTYVQPGSEELPYEEVAKMEDTIVHDEEEIDEPPELVPLPGGYHQEPPPTPPAPAVYIAPPIQRFVDVPSVPSGASSVDPALHARVLQIEAMKIKKHMEEENKKTREQQEMKIAALESQIQSLEKRQNSMKAEEEVKSPKEKKKKKKKKVVSMGFESEYDRYPRHASDGDFAFYSKMYSTRTEDAVWEPYQPTPVLKQQRSLQIPPFPSDRFSATDAYMYDDDESDSLPTQIVAAQGGVSQTTYSVLPLGSEIHTNTPISRGSGEFPKPVKQYADAACSVINPTPESSVRRSVEVDPGLLRELEMDVQFPTPLSTCDSLPEGVMCLESFGKSSVPLPPSVMQSMMSSGDGGEPFEQPDEYQSPVRAQTTYKVSRLDSLLPNTRAVARPLPPLPSPPPSEPDTPPHNRHLSPPRTTRLTAPSTPIYHRVTSTPQKPEAEDDIWGAPRVAPTMGSARPPLPQKAVLPRGNHPWQAFTSVLEGMYQ